MNEIGGAITLISLAAIFGLWLGQFKVNGMGLGVGGVLFGGILISYIAQFFDITPNAQIMGIMQDFGLMLFVYTIGIQVGPGFFASLKHSGVRWNILASGVVLLGCLFVIIFILLGIPLPQALGVYSGSVTNTPSLGAGQGIITTLMENKDAALDITAIMGMSYATAYPMGLAGLLVVMWGLRKFFKIDIAAEAAAIAARSAAKRAALTSINVKITNKNFNGLKLCELPDFDHQGVAFSRLKRGDDLSIPHRHTILELGDILHLVGDKEKLHNMLLILGEEVQASMTTKGTNFKSERVVVTNEKVLGKKIGDVFIDGRYDIVVSRLNRAGVELVPTANTYFQFGDVINLVGDQEDIKAAMVDVGNAQAKLQQVQMISLFIGLFLGILVGSIPLSIPGIPTPIKLGLAGGPLVMAILLSRIGSMGRYYWFMPPGANLALREFGLIVFLAIVGLKSGRGFFANLFSWNGILWFICGAIITIVPTIIMGWVGRKFMKLDYFSLFGVLGGSTSNPLTIAFAAEIKEDNGRIATAYAGVYPMVMFLRIISPQILAILFWSMSMSS